MLSKLEETLVNPNSERQNAPIAESNVTESSNSSCCFGC
jgi:hypothetical protein